MLNGLRKLTLLNINFQSLKELLVCADELERAEFNYLRNLADMLNSGRHRYLVVSNMKVRGDVSFCDYNYLSSSLRNMTQIWLSEVFFA